MWGYVLISTIAGLATGLGGGLVVIFGRPSTRFLSTMLGLAGGIMLAISAFDLIPEAYEMGGTWLTVVGIALGAAIIYGLDLVLPHIHKSLQSSEGLNGGGLDWDCQNLLRCGIFLALGIGLHNLPEGLAIGAGYTADEGLGSMIALGLALHNIPEGMVTAAPLFLAGVNRWTIILITTAAGLVTPIGTAVGYLLVGINPAFLAVALGVAAGAMIYIVGDELIPESHQYHSHAANLGLLAGFILVFVMG
ncbi:MAG: ZIP family metal transporter [Bacillota bacterium]|jgi:ZIP family zinc transporter